MGKYEINVTDDVAEELILELIDKLEIETYGEVKDGVPFFLSTFQWLNPKLEDVVTDKATLAKFLANIFSCVGATKGDIIKMFTNFYGFYDDADLIPDFERECWMEIQ